MTYKNQSCPWKIKEFTRDKRPVVDSALLLKEVQTHYPWFGRMVILTKCIYSLIFLHIHGLEICLNTVTQERVIIAQIAMYDFFFLGGGLHNCTKDE